MKKKEKIEELEYENIPSPEVKTTEDMEIVSVAGESADIEEKEAEAHETAEDSSRKDEERILRIEQLFGSYPDTCSLLTGDKDFRIDDKLENFMATVGGFARGGKLSPQEIDSALGMLFSISSIGRGGIPTLDMVEVLMKGLSYDRKIAEEIHAAELRGRNANIEAKMRSRTASDGVPHLESRSSGTERKNRGIFSLAEKARR